MLVRRQQRLEQKLAQLHAYGSVPIGNGDFLVYLPRVKEKWGGVPQETIAGGELSNGVRRHTNHVAHVQVSVRQYDADNKYENKRQCYDVNTTGVHLNST
jgi:hypothetical protein